MIASKHINQIVGIVTTVAVLLCLLGVCFSDKLISAIGSSAITMEYEERLFNTDEVIDIDVQMDSDSWQDMLDNAIDEEYYQCNVVINGETFYDVGIRPKGNTSLSSIVSDSTTDRYSFKIEFDHYVDGQYCYGLDKLILNNNYADSTNMKETIVYDMFQYLGTDASLYNYANISVNGEYWGIYLALEGVEDSFMLRNYGTSNGNLYKPESMGMGNDDGGGMPDMGNFNIDGSMDEVRKVLEDYGVDMDEILQSIQEYGLNGMDEIKKTLEDSGIDVDSLFQTLQRSMHDSDRDAPDMDGSQTFEDDTSNSDRFSKMDDGDRGGFSMNGSGADLNYSDDELDSYSTIWDGSITNTTDSDHKKVVEAIKNVNEGTNLERYLDVDNVLKYMAVHTFVVNLDSLSGNMSHNYYIYESDGRLNILPWDYNLAFGGMSMGMGGSSGGASSTINFPIDTPFQGTNFFDKLLENEEYLEKYHYYLDILSDEYVNGGTFDETYGRIQSQIDELVKTDPNAFYTYEEYQEGSSMLYDTIKLRAESVQGQLNGSVPSTQTAQNENPDALIDATSIDLSVMGSMNNGGGEDNFDRGDFAKGDRFSSTKENKSSLNTIENVNDFVPSDAQMQPPDVKGNGFDTSYFDGEMPEDFDPNTSNGEVPKMSNGFNPDSSGGGGDVYNDMDKVPTDSTIGTSTNTDINDTYSESDNVDSTGKGFTNDGNFSPDGMPNMSFGDNSSSNSNTVLENATIYAVCFVIILVALILVKAYKRKSIKK